jgi:alanine dehydrogenase
MYKEKNERRAFLPDFFKQLASTGTPIFLESGYGSRMGYDEEDYRSVNENIVFTSEEEANSQDVVVVLRSPRNEELDSFTAGTTLVSMLHYPTREHRTRILKEKGIKAVSLDSIRDDFMQRMVYNPKGTSYNGMELAFRELSAVRKDFFSKGRAPIEVTIIGMGMIGHKAARAAAHFGSKELYDEVKARMSKGVIVHMLPRSITSDRFEMSRILAGTDILVDATTRDNPYKFIVDNDLLAVLKDDAIILDLTADPYLSDDDGVQVKAIEGIPTGNLNKYVLRADDPSYDEIPAVVSTVNRRTVVSCDAWPGVKPELCMRLYGAQLLPILLRLIDKDVSEMSLDSGDYYERAIHRATIAFYEEHEKSATRA